MIKNILTLIFIILILPFSSFAEDDGYPKSREERKADEMGSMIGGEGIVFRPGKIRNEETKTPESKINKFLWQASTEILSNIAPLIVKDENRGIISTDWFSNIDHPNSSSKINVVIMDNIISPESIDVNIQHKTLKNGRWLEENLERAMKMDIEAKILRRAKDIYINHSK